MTAQLKATMTLLVLISATSAVADAEPIARWVDEDGITHFGDRQFAPSTAETIEISRPNGMAVPETSGVGSSNGPRWTKLTLPPKQNRKGWRSRGASTYGGRKHQSNRTRRHR